MRGGRRQRGIGRDDPAPTFSYNFLEYHPNGDGGSAQMITEAVNTVILNTDVWLWLGAGALLLVFARGNRRRMTAAAVFLALLWVTGTAPFARVVLRPLETRYAPPTLAALQARGVRRVVVLTGGGYPRTGELASGALPHASTLRFIAGLELCARLAPDCEIIYSGSAGSGNTSVQAAGTMQELGKTLTPDMPSQSESDSDSTIEHPQNVKPLVQDEPFVLVTSAYHMPRAMLVFARAGMDAIPYPVDSLTHDGWQWSDLLPSSTNREALNLALHEYAGILAYNLFQN